MPQRFLANFAIFPMLSLLLAMACQQRQLSELSFEMAAKAALTQFQGEVEEMELVEKATESKHYVIVIRKNGKLYQLKVDAYDGKVFSIQARYNEPSQGVLNPERDRGSKGKRFHFPKQETAIAPEEAVLRARHRIPGQLKEIELERKAGVERYIVEIEKNHCEYEIAVDANTGKILFVRQDDDCL